ncbi:MFS transporter [Halorubrum sp. JWXQ-INN 858]|uniref:MFS transporter n=1 Tax=Halorubrum sp. JWXQ-INN 858 TaxID=2690782 RepID=UPI00190F6961|nr:MFS transporter [Halorubrum sp. JWXQ-INN 858]
MSDGSWIGRQTTHVGAILADLRRGGRGWILAAVAGGWLLSLGVRLVFPALLPEFRGAFDLTLTTSGVLISVLWYAYALGQFPGGYLGDRFGPRLILVGSTLISAVTILGVALAPDWRVLFVATALFGFSTALYGTIRFTILTDIYSRRDGTAVALTLAAGDIGNAALPPIAVALAAVASWRLGIGFTVPLFLAMTAVLWWAIPSAGESLDEEADDDHDGEDDGGKDDDGEADEDGPVDGRGEDARSDGGGGVGIRYIVTNVLVGPILVATTIQFLAFFAWQGFTSFFVTYLVEIKGFSIGLASTLFGFFFLLGLVVRPVAGASHDALGPRATLAIVMSLITAGLVTLTHVEGFVPLVLVTVLLSSLLGFTPATQTYIANALPDDMKGSGLGLLRTGHMVFGATSAIVVGYVADAGFFDEAFLMLAAFSGLAVLMSLLLPRRD